MEPQSGSLGPDHLASAQHSVISYSSAARAKAERRRRVAHARLCRTSPPTMWARAVGITVETTLLLHATMQAPQVQGPYDLEL